SASRIGKTTTQEERRRLATMILTQLEAAVRQAGTANIEHAAFSDLRQTLADTSADFAERGLTPSETATFIFSLKGALFEVYQQQSGSAGSALWEISQLIDQLGLYSFESFATARERIIKSQAQAISELATPVIQVWEGVVALPLVGSIDSARAKEIMENLLEAVVAYQADIVIIDITGVPVVDTQVANRLMRTVEAVRLLGTRSIITGINPVIAQTLVQLGVDLSQLTTKSSLRSGLQQAFRDLKLKVVAQEGKR
ncbi:MAG: STAS domain-containing protein, partial [Candidatus Sericytochromatia bacterium]